MEDIQVIAFLEFIILVWFFMDSVCVELKSRKDTIYYENVIKSLETENTYLKSVIDKV